MMTANNFMEHSIVLTNLGDTRDQVLTKFVITPEFIKTIKEPGTDSDRVFSLNADVEINGKPTRFTVELTYTESEDDAKTFCQDLLKQVTAYNSLDRSANSN